MTSTLPDLNSILDDLADALELERELGVRVVACDRALLKGGAGTASPVSRGEVARPETRDANQTVSNLKSDDPPAPAPAPAASSPLPFVFLHDRALSPGGVEMMAKIVTALHRTPETAPVLFTGARPAARVTVVLGHRALRKWFPNAAGAPGQWIAPDGTPNVLVTYSPEYILRFGAATPAVQKLKREMWTSLKGALQRMT